MTQERVRMDMYGKDIAGEKRHAQAVMKELAERENFEIVESEGRAIFDCWYFKIRYSDRPNLPPFISRDLA